MIGKAREEKVCDLAGALGDKWNFTFFSQNKLALTY